MERIFLSFLHPCVAENLGCLGPKPIQVKVIYSLLPSTPVRLPEPPENYVGCFKYLMESKMSNFLAPVIPSLWDLAIPGVEYKEGMNLH